MHDRGIKAESETVGHVPRFGVPQRNGPVKVGRGVKVIEGAYAGSNDNAPYLKGSRTMAEVGSEGCPGQAAPQPIVSKRQGSFYKSGPSRNWPKAKNPNRSLPEIQRVR